MTADLDLPAGLAARAREFASGRLEAAVPRDAATVVLVRDGADGVEAYLLRRVAAMAFAAGMHVFPGGSVDSRDVDAAIAWAGPPPHVWAGQLGCDEGLARALVCAAVRETFEESGVLLAGPDPGTVVPDTTGEDWEADRLALLDRSLPFAELLVRRALVLRSDLLRAWTHWITPEFEPRRFDTRFFVAALPTGQCARDVGGEADAVAWVRPTAAVAGYERGELAMLPPTVVTLRELAAYDEVADVLRAFRTLSPILPRAVLSGTDIRLLLPGEIGYPG